MVKLFFVCNNCGARVSNLLNYEIALDFTGKAEDELLLKGQYGINDDGNFYLSLSDKHNLSYHQDLSRMAGCCGPSSYGLPNLVCICKSEIGREVTDCCTAHYITLYKDKVTMREDSAGLLAEVLNLPVAEDIKHQYEILMQFGEIESILKEFRKDE